MSVKKLNSGDRNSGDRNSGYENTGDRNTDTEYGTTLRDYFAAKALQTSYAAYLAYAGDNGWDHNWQRGAARDAYAMADAMIAAREV